MKWEDNRTTTHTWLEHGFQPLLFIMCFAISHVRRGLARRLLIKQPDQSSPVPSLNGDAWLLMKFCLPSFFSFPPGCYRTERNLRDYCTHPFTRSKCKCFIIYFDSCIKLSLKKHTQTNILFLPTCTVFLKRHSARRRCCG